MTRNYRLTKEEQETVIGCSAADREWDIVTADPRFARYLRKRGWTLEPDRQFPTHLMEEVMAATILLYPFHPNTLQLPQAPQRRKGGAVWA